MNGEWIYTTPEAIRQAELNPPRIDYSGVEAWQRRRTQEALERLRQKLNK